MPLITTFGAGSVRGLGRAARLVPPGIPTGFSVTGRTRLDGAGGANVYFTPPVDNGGAPILNYQVQNLSTSAISTVGSSGELLSLPNNVEQLFRIRAVNAAGPGEWSSTDAAFAGYQSYSPGNGGGSTTFTLSAGFGSLVYQVYSNGGASAKPDTRTYSTLYGSSNQGWWGPSLIWDTTNGLPYWWSHHRQAEGYGWYNYTPNWDWISGNLVYGWGNFTAGSWEYYYMYTTNSGPGWGNGDHIGYFAISPSPQQVQTGGSAPQGEMPGTSSSISVPGWGSDQTGSGYGGYRSVISGTANLNPNSSTNVTVNIGYSQGDYAYSTAGAAIIAYGR